MLQIFLFVGCLEFASGIVARLTCSIVAPHDHSIRIVGENGVIYLRECWNYDSPIYIQKINTRLIRLEEFIEKILGIHIRLQGTRYPLVRQPKFNPPRIIIGNSKIIGYYRDLFFGYKQDFARGVAELANAIQENRSCRLSADLALHITELTLVLQHPEFFTMPYNVESSFETFPPMSWAQ
jgi:predicted dehydrogenase